MNRLSDSAILRLCEGLAIPSLPERYHPVDVIGRGGMGVVWRARDATLEREVAVKVVAEHLADDEWGAHMEREAHILARLEHPGIVAVHDTGVLQDGRAWYAMRLVRGDRLDLAAPRFTTVGEAVRVVIRIADTVAFAHAHQVLHRDLNPRNIMLGPFGEVLVLDWGVARLGGDEKDAPLPVATDRRVIGTPGFMSPEQATGGAIDERSDVYGVGAILQAVLAAAQVPVPKSLASICNCAMSADPARRYQNVCALREDLERFQDSVPVVAHQEGLVERVTRVISQYRVPILLVISYLLMRVAVLWWKGI